jgi:hypothetical protein
VSSCYHGLMGTHITPSSQAMSFVCMPSNNERPFELALALHLLIKGLLHNVFDPQVCSLVWRDGIMCTKYILSHDAFYLFSESLR